MAKAAAEGNNLRFGIALASSNLTIPIYDFRRFTSWIFTHQGPAPVWSRVDNPHCMRQMVVWFLNGLDVTTFALNAASMPYLSSLSFGLATAKAQRGRMGNIMSAIETILLQRKKTNSNGQNKSQQKRVLPGPEAYILSERELSENEYPVINDENLSQGFVATQPTEPGKQFHRMIAMDCEMCLTKDGRELARCTLVDEEENILMDLFVKPENPILDYLTKFSGITPELLESATHTLASVQQELLKHISSETILVGHSLENDLKACKLLHRKIIDTAIAFPHIKGPPLKSSLKYLVRTRLNRQIQNDEGGHNSIEDALACLHLVMLKLKNGPEFGSMEGEVESLFNCLKAGTKSAIIDNESNLRKYMGGSVHPIVTNDLGATTDYLTNIVSETEESEMFQFVVAETHDLADYYKRLDAQNQQRQQQTTAAAASNDEEEEEGEIKQNNNNNNNVAAMEISSGAENETSLSRILSAVDSSVKSVASAAKPNTLLVILGGQGDINKIDRLVAMKMANITKGGVAWGSSEEDELEKLTKRAQDGIAIVCSL